jgi:hypothetical protein
VTASAWATGAAATWPDSPGRPVAARLRAVLDQAEPALRGAAAGLWSAPGLGERYPRYLQAMHGVLRASVPLMERAAARCAEFLPQDPSTDRLRDYLVQHAGEERGHDAWAREDLALLGGDLAAACDEQPWPDAAALVGPQYYWIEHHHPVALLGYIAVLEGNAPRPGLAEWIAAGAGVPDAALRTVREHADLDTGHTEAIYRLLDSLHLDAAQERAVTVSALYTADALIRLLNRLTETAPGRRLRRTAPPNPGETA